MGGDRREWKGTESVLVCQVPYLVSRYKVVGGGVLPGTWYCSAAAALPAPDVDMRLIRKARSRYLPADFRIPSEK